MPTYEYHCDAGHETEHRQSMSEDPLDRCPREGCAAEAERKISMGLGIHHGSKGSSSAGGRAGECGPRDTGFT